MKKSLLFLLLTVFGSPGLVAQRLQPATASFSASAELADEPCAAAQLRQAVRQPFTTVAHRQQMDRYDVKYYKLDLALENNTTNIGGHVWIRARNGAAALDKMAFELYSTYTIDSVVVNRRKATSISRANGDVTATLAAAVPAGELFDARIYYRGTAPASANAVLVGNALTTRVNAYGTNVTWSLSEPFYAYEWFPCKQVLTDKADSSDVWVTTRLLNKVGSNGVLTKITPISSIYHRYEWKSRHPIAYYLISVAVSPYLEYVNYANLADGTRVPIVNYVYNDLALSDFKAEIDRTPGFLEHFSELTVPYPFADEKYGHSMAPMGGGMEHQTMTTQDGFNFTLTAHELFHQWFGNNVTCASWEDIWLNESFASYGEFLALSRFSSPTAARDWLVNAQLRARYTYNSSTRKYDIYQPAGSVRVPDTTNVNRIFSTRLSYRKGATVVHMLRYLLQDDTKFFNALRNYQRTFANGTARTPDLQRIFEEQAGRSLTYFFDQWYRGEGFPSFAVEWKQTGGNLQLRNTETTSMPSVTPFFDTDLDYLITTTTGAQTTVRLRQGQPVSEFSVPVSGQVSSVVLDPSLWVLKGTSSVTRNDQLVLATAHPTATPLLAVFPNPCDQELWLGSLPAGGWHAVVTDGLGREVMQQELVGTAPRLRTAALAPGIYQLQLQSKTGQAVRRARFVRR